MAYEPLRGWVQVTRVNGVLRSQRFHSDRTCADRWVVKEKQRAVVKGAVAESWVVGPYTYGQARRFKPLKLCRCSGGHRRHAEGQERRWNEVSAGSQGTGRRR